MTTSNHQPPSEVLERYAAAQPTMQKFYDMAVNFFRCKCLDKTNLERRPPVALCVRDPDHVFTAKPGFLRPRKEVGGDGIERVVEYGRVEFDTVYIDGVSVTETTAPDGRPLLQHHRACKLRLDEAGRLTQAGTWYSRYAPVAVHEFVNTAAEFLLFPWQVLSRSRDRCCCCRRALTDATSRSRGIGPECLRTAALCFGEPPVPA